MENRYKELDKLEKAEAIETLEKMRDGYKMLIEQEVKAGKIIGREFKGEWEAKEAPIESYRKSIKALQVAIDAIKKDQGRNRGMIKRLEELRENAKGKAHWVMPVQDDGMSDPIHYQVRCSKCGFDLDPQTWHMELHQYGADKYCPKCGSKMYEDKGVLEQLAEKQNNLSATNKAWSDAIEKNGYVK